MEDLSRQPDIPIDLIGAAASTVVIESKVTGDAQWRYTQKVDGTQSWGPGSGAVDVSFGRVAVAAWGPATDNAYDIGDATHQVRSFYVGTSITVSAMTSGSVAFFGAGGLFSQNNAKLYWSIADEVLAIGTNAPSVAENVRFVIKGKTAMATLSDDDYAIFHTNDAYGSNPLQLSFGPHCDPTSGNRYNFVQSAFLGAAGTILYLNPIGGYVKIGINGNPGAALGINLAQFTNPAAMIDLIDDGSGIRMTRGTVQYYPGFLSTSVAFSGTQSNHPWHVQTNGTVRWIYGASGHITANSNNAYDIGSASAAPRSIYWGTQALAAQGSAAAPSHSFAAQTDTGMYLWAGNILGFAAAGTDMFYNGVTAQLVIYSIGAYGIGSSGTASPDVFLYRDGAGIFAQRNGANAQQFNIYNTYTSSSVFEHFRIIWVGNECYLQTNAGASGGSQRNLHIGSAGAAHLLLGNADQWKIDGNVSHLLASTDNSYDIGADGATRPRFLFFGSQCVGPSDVQAYAFGGATTTGLARRTSGVSSNWMSLDVGNNQILGFVPGFVMMASGTVLSWTDSATIGGVTNFDVQLARDAAGVLALKDGANAQTFRVYGTTTGPAYLTVQHTGSLGRIFTVGAHALQLGADTTLFWSILAGGSLVAVTDNSYDIGASGATRPRTIYVGTSINAVAGAVTLDTNGITMGDAKNIIVNATTGTKIGTATTQKLSFWNATPVVQPAGIVDADGTLADITTKFNSWLAKAESMGLLAVA